jgi:hypothetical protein
VAWSCSVRSGSARSERVEDHVQRQTWLRREGHYVRNADRCEATGALAGSAGLLLGLVGLFAGGAEPFQHFGKPFLR